MAIVLTTNKTLESIVEEVQKLDKAVQEEILVFIRAKRLLLTDKYPKLKSKEKPLTMKEIDEIKHKARKSK